MNIDDFLTHDLNRRRFLGHGAAGAAGMAAGVVGLHQEPARGSSPSMALRVGVIGVRSQGKKLATTLARMPEWRVEAVCDVDESMRRRAAETVAKEQMTTPRQVADFQRLLEDTDIDAVVVATPDHWHAVMTTLAAEAGKHVYVEKPVSSTIDEGRAMIGAAERNQVLVQCGLQQRSGDHFRSAVELVRDGGIGTVRLAKAWSVHRRQSIGHKPDGPVPTGVDYDLWIGPAAAQPFNVNRFHHHWRWNWAFGTGSWATGACTCWTSLVGVWGSNCQVASRPQAVVTISMMINKPPTRWR